MGGKIEHPCQVEAGADDSVEKGVLGDRKISIHQIKADDGIAEQEEQKANGEEGSGAESETGKQKIKDQIGIVEHRNQRQCVGLFLQHGHGDDEDGKAECGARDPLRAPLFAIGHVIETSGVTQLSQKEKQHGRELDLRLRPYQKIVGADSENERRLRQGVVGGFFCEQRAEKTGENDRCERAGGYGSS